MSILVTGGAGFIGKHVVAELESRGIVADVFDRPDNVCNARDVRIAMMGVGGVINLAGALGTSELIGAEADAVHANILGAINVYRAAAEYDVPVVQVATGHRGQLNPYAITKACAEDLALARTGQPISVVRAYHVYGPGQKMCPPHGKSTVRKIVPSFAARALTGMPVEIHGTGEQLIDLVYVADVAKVLVDALHGPWGTVIEAGTGKPTTVLDAARAVIHAARSTSPIEHLPMRPGEPVGATVVAENPLCHNPWPHRLDETVDWYRAELGL